MRIKLEDESIVKQAYRVRLQLIQTTDRHRPSGLATEPTMSSRHQPASCSTSSTHAASRRPEIKGLDTAANAAVGWVKHKQPVLRSVMAFVRQVDKHEPAVQKLGATAFREEVVAPA